MNFEADDLVAIIRLLNQPWWERGWIRQEIIVSNRPLIQLGDLIHDWTEIAPGLNMLGTHAYTAAAIPGVRLHELTPADKLWSDFYKADISHLLPLVSFRTAHKNSVSGLPWKTTVNDLIMSNHSSCTDVRDRVFSLNGLTNDLGTMKPHN
jgi:hypothetical protein